jgi:hypothetical protein
MKMYLVLYCGNAHEDVVPVRVFFSKEAAEKWVTEKGPRSKYNYYIEPIEVGDSQ